MNSSPTPSRGGGTIPPLLSRGLNMHSPVSKDPHWHFQHLFLFFSPPCLLLHGVFSKKDKILDRKKYELCTQMVTNMFTYMLFTLICDCSLFDFGADSHAHSSFCQMPKHLTAHEVIYKCIILLLTTDFQIIPQVFHIKYGHSLNEQLL